VAAGQCAIGALLDGTDERQRVEMPNFKLRHAMGRFALECLDAETLLAFGLPAGVRPLDLWSTAMDRCSSGSTASSTSPHLATQC